MNVRPRSALGAYALFLVGAGLFAVADSASADAPPAGRSPEEGARTICVYDPAGKAGDYYGILTDLSAAAATFDEAARVEIVLKAYLDEETATRDYEAKKCDGVVATGVRLQRFNRFPTTVEAMGAIESYDVLKEMIDSLAKYESAARLMKNGEHDTVGIIPIGAVYLFVRDKRVRSVGALAGKRIATMTYDKASPVMVRRVGAIIVPADLSSIGPKFNNGDVDACYVSAPAYRPFELQRGLGEKGGILRLPLAQATLQVLVRASRFPAGFPAKARTWFAGQFDKAIDIVERAEKDIDPKYWVPIAKGDIPGFDDMFLKVRLSLRDDVKAYDGSMLTALRRIRCRREPARAECAEKLE